MMLWFIIIKTLTSKKYENKKLKYNTDPYNTVLDITRIRAGPQMAISVSFSHIIYPFYSQYNTDWIANMEIGLDPNNSIMKRLWCTCIRKCCMLKNATSTDVEE